MVWDTVTSANGNVCGRLIASPTGAKTTYAPLSDILLKASLCAPSAPAGHLPREGEAYIWGDLKIAPTASKLVKISGQIKE